MATGDHRSKDSQVFITEYDPVKKEQGIVVDVGKTCGWKKALHTDGKIHGRMDIMTRPLSMWCIFPNRNGWSNLFSPYYFTSIMLRAAV